jgi:hypothetical protein
MGGTGLEPVTPSLSSWQPAIPSFAVVRVFSTICRRFRSRRGAGLALACARSRTLVVARGSTVHRSPTLRTAHPASRARACNQKQRNRQAPAPRAGPEPANRALESSGLRSEDARAWGYTNAIPLQIGNFPLTAGFVHPTGTREARRYSCRWASAAAAAVGPGIGKGRRSPWAEFD